MQSSINNIINILIADYKWNENTNSNAHKGTRILAQDVHRSHDNEPGQVAANNGKCVTWLRAITKIIFGAGKI